MNKEKAARVLASNPNATIRFDRYDSVMEYDYINYLKIMDSVKEIVGKEQIDKWKNMMV